MVNEYLAYLGLTNSAIGNHEFDWGPNHFNAWSKDGRFPFLAANIIDKRTGQIPPWTKSHQIVLLGGHKIASIGFFTVETLSKTKADYSADYDFLEPAKVAARLVPEILRDEKPQLIIAATHLPSVADPAQPGKASGMPELYELDALAKVPESMP